MENFQCLKNISVAANMDVPDDGVAGSNSFIVSAGDPTTGFFLPRKKSYFYSVRCKNAITCSFTKKSFHPAYENPDSPVTMSIPKTDRNWVCP